MKKKDIKKLIAPLAAVMALGLSAFLGLGQQATTELEGAIVTAGTSLVTILGLFGVWTNNDKS